MTFDYKSYCQYCVVCNRAKPDSRGRDAFQTSDVPKYPWEFFIIYYVIHIPKK
jgi:hypothetical protein